MHRFQGQACCFACVVWTVPLEHILSQPLGVHARLMSHNAFMKRSLLSEVCGEGTVVLCGCWVHMLFHCTTQILILPACRREASPKIKMKIKLYFFPGSAGHGLGRSTFHEEARFGPEVSEPAHKPQDPPEPLETPEPPEHAEALRAPRIYRAPQARNPEVPRAPGNPKAPRAPQTRRTEKSPQRNQPEPPDPCDMTSAPGAPTHTTLPMKKTQLSCCLRIDGTLNEKRASVTACACVLEFNTKLLHVHLYS